MASNRKKIGFLEVLGYIVGGLMLLPALVFRSVAAPAYLTFGLAAIGLLVILGSITFLGNRRILPVGIGRDGEAVICRYVPWYELNNYTLFTVVPIMGLAFIAAGLGAGRPRWLTFVGILVIGVIPLAGYFVGQMWQRCLVKISPSTLAVRLPARGSQLIEIPRSSIQSISAANAEVGAAFAPVTVNQVAINYQPAGQRGGTATVLIGPPPGKTALQVSVQPTNVYNALMDWNKADPDDPRLMDRIEAILRGKEPARL